MDYGKRDIVKMKKEGVRVKSLKKDSSKKEKKKKKSNQMLQTSSKTKIKRV